MRRSLAASALFALAVLATTATGQPQPGGPLPNTLKKADPKPASPADRTEAAIAAALAHDPDVKMAQAKIQLAEAELAKARQAATLKVLSLNARAEQAKSDVRAAEAKLRHVIELARTGIQPETEAGVAREKVEAAKAALAAAETELKLLTGGGAAPHARAADPTALAWFAERLGAGQGLDGLSGIEVEFLRTARSATVKGPIPDRLRAALDKPVRLPKGQVRFEGLMDAFADAGFDVSIRSPGGFPAFDSDGGELPIGAWLQLLQDESGRTFYVREYGLLFADKKAAPPDAPTLTEFWKQKPPAAKPESKGEPPPTPKAK